MTWIDADVLGIMSPKEQSQMKIVSKYRNFTLAKCIQNANT